MAISRPVLLVSQEISRDVILSCRLATLLALVTKAAFSAICDSSNVYEYIQEMESDEQLRF